MWQPVFLRAGGDVAIRYPCVASHVDTATLASADLTVGTLLRNWSKADAELQPQVDAARRHWIVASETAPR